MQYQPMYGYQPQYQPMPYQQQYQQQQNFQQLQQPQAVGVPGRVVSGVAEIKVDDVPTDGTVGWFPLSDGSAVIGKRWTSDGNIVTATYMLQQQEQQQDPMDIVTNKLDQILEAVTTKPAKHATKDTDND